MSPYPRIMSFDIDPMKFDFMLKEARMWEFDENGDVLPENQERYDNLMAEWDAWEDDAVLEDWDDEPGWDEDDMDGDQEAVWQIW